MESISGQTEEKTEVRSLVECEFCIPTVSIIPAIFFQCDRLWRRNTKEDYQQVVLSCVRIIYHSCLAFRDEMR